MPAAPTLTKGKPGDVAKQGVGEGEKPHGIEATLRKLRMPELFQDPDRGNLVRVLFNDSQPHAFDCEELFKKISDPSKVFPCMDELVRDGLVIEGHETRGEYYCKTYRLAPLQYALLARIHKADPSAISSLVEAAKEPADVSTAKISKIVQDLVLMYMSKNRVVAFQELEQVICNPGLMDMRSLYFLLKELENRGLLGISDLRCYENGTVVIRITSQGEETAMQLSQHEKEAGYPVTTAYAEAVIEAHASSAIPWILR